MMRGINTTVRRLRRKVFEEVAALGFKADADTLCDDMEAIPYALVNDETEQYRDSVYRARAVVREQVRLAMGLALRPEDKPVHLTAGVEASNISDKYYEPPLMQVIPSACMRCEAKGYEVSNMCKGCLAHPCMEVCPKGAITIKHGKSVIDQSKCIKCGRCQSVCPYNAINKMERPCARACGMDAIGSDEEGKAKIDYDKCVSCGMCLVNCPFGAIVDKGQIFQLITAMKKKKKVIAIVAPAFVGQFGPKASPEKLTAAMKKLGFADVVEVAIGADLCSIEEAKDFMREVPEHQPFMATSCCPAWSVMAKKLFPTLAPYISMALTPMVLTARMLKKDDPDACIAFIGPCAAKKLEASRRTIRSDVDFVLTFEELMGMFNAKGVTFEDITDEEKVDLCEGTGDGRGFAVSGGVAKAVADVIHKLDPEREVKVVSAQGLKDCRKLLTLAKAGKYDGYLLEGMACPGGCVAGAGTLQAVEKSTALVNKYVKDAPLQNSLDSKYEINLDLITESHDDK